MGKALVVLLAVATRLAEARTAVMETIAGGSVGDGLKATEVSVAVKALTVDEVGNLYLSDRGRVRRVDIATGIISTLIPPTCESGDGCVGPAGLTFDLDGNLLVADRGMILRLNPKTGEVARVAGRDDTGEPCVPAENVPASAACLLGSTDIAVDPDGHVLIASGFRVLRVNVETGLVATYAGDGEPDQVYVDGGPATNAGIGLVVGISVEPDGDVLIASRDFWDSWRGLLWRVDRATGAIRRIDGDGILHDCSRGEPYGRRASAVCLPAPFDVALDRAGNILFPDTTSGSVLRVHAVSGIVSQGHAPFGLLHVDRAGNIFSAARATVTRTDRASRRTERVAGNGSANFCGDSLPATAACLAGPGDVAFDPAGNLLILDEQNGRIRRVDASTGVIATVAGGGGYCADSSNDPVPACEACLGGARTFAVSPSGDIFFTDRFVFVDELGQEQTWVPRIRRISAETGVVSTVVGRCLRPGELSGIPAVEACLDYGALAFDGEGDLHITAEGQVFRIDQSTGVLSAVAGSDRTGCPAETEEGGLALAACLSPEQIAFDAAGNLFVREWARVRRVDRATGIITTVAGNGQEYCRQDNRVRDGEVATAGCLQSHEFAVDAPGNLYLAASGSLKRVDGITGVIETLAGPSDDGCCGGLCGPSPAEPCVPAFHLVLDPAGRIVFSDPRAGIVRRTSQPHGVVVAPPGESEARLHDVCAERPLRDCKEDGDCADRDACTLDVCRRGLCGHEPAGGTRCTIRQVAALCANDTIPRGLKVARWLKMARRLLQWGESDSVPSSRRAHVAETLRRLDRQIRALIAGGRMTADCGGGLIERIRRLEWGVVEER